MIFVFIGGMLGAASRFAISTYINNRWPFLFPLATFLINSIGCFFIGLFTALELATTYNLFLLIGLLGGFTTLSTFSVENARLLLVNKPFVSISYVIISAITCVLLTFIGFSLV